MGKRTIAQLNFSLPVQITKDKETDWFVSSCNILDISSMGKDKEEARNNLIEAISLFVVSCFERGTLEAVLKECGFQAVHKKKPEIFPHDYIDVPIPFYLNKEECRV